jgi:photosynthetic reaction center H subunit
MSAAMTEYIDVAQVVLYLFWGFFFGLIFWLRREDRREGYPLENDNNAATLPATRLMIPLPKTFLLPHGGSVQAPNFVRDTRPINATRTANAAGAPLEVTGDPMTANMGPGSYAQRADEPELGAEGHLMIVPLRAAEHFSVSAGPDPRGWPVMCADGGLAGKVSDLWVDTVDSMVRYLEVDLGSSKRLVPLPMALIERAHVQVASVRSTHFASVPTLKNADSITLLEEEKISAFFAGGRLYRDPSRLGPLL